MQAFLENRNWGHDKLLGDFFLSLFPPFSLISFLSHSFPLFLPLFLAVTFLTVELMVRTYGCRLSVRPSSIFHGYIVAKRCEIVLGCY